MTFKANNKRKLWVKIVDLFFLRGQ